jgi:hypothetical protein
MARVSPSDTRYWSFAQALAWTIYRRNDLVDYVGPGRGGRLSLVAAYPSQFSPPPERIGDGDALLQALRDGRLKATGIPASGDGLRREIPAEDWLRLKRHGASVFQISDDRLQTLVPWRDITLRSASVKNLWRSGHEVSGRSKYDWYAIQRLYQELRASNPDFSQNELIIETQGRYQEEFNKEPPSRSAFQRQIRTWN